LFYIPLESCGRKIPQLFSFSTHRWGIMGEIELLRGSILMTDSASTGNALKATAAGSVFD
jgi:hypothetical protein